MEALQQLLFRTTPLDDMPVQADYRIKTYAIIDCASDEQHYKQLLSQELKHAILYKDEDASNLELVAPYLIELDEEHDYSQWLMQEQWNTHSVIYLKSHYGLEPLAEHLRRYTKVVVEPRENDNRNDETLAFFAFYDPRVLKNYLTVLTKEQMNEICQPVISFSYEDKDLPDHLLTSYLSNTGEQWRTQVVAFKDVTIKERKAQNDTDNEQTLDDDIEVPITSVIFTVAQQIQFDELQRKQFCEQLLLDLQGHYDVSTNDIDAAMLYSKEADNNGLRSEATQSRYILIGLLIQDSPVNKSKYLRQSLSLDVDEHARKKTLDKALEELSMHKEQAHVR